MKTITLDILQKTAPHKDKLMMALRDMIKGEKDLAEPIGSDDDLLKELQLIAPTAPEKKKDQEACSQFIMLQLWIQAMTEAEKLNFESDHQHYLVKPFFLQSDRYKKCGWYRSQSMGLNGATEIAKNWSGTLRLLTARLDIHRMTCIPWASGLAVAGLLCRTVRWCPTCYYDWQQNSKPIYQPLLWMLQVMKICPHHRKQLEERCPSCHKNAAEFLLSIRLLLLRRRNSGPPARAMKCDGLPEPFLTRQYLRALNM